MKLLKQIWSRLQFVFKSLFFARYIPSAVAYSFRRDRIDRHYLKASGQKANNTSIIKPGKLRQVHTIDQEEIEQGARFEFETATLEVVFLTDDFVRIHWSPGLLPIPYAIAEQKWEKVETSLTQQTSAEQDSGWQIASATIRVEVSCEGAIAISQRDRLPLRKEMPPWRQGDRWTHKAELQPEEQIYGLGERATASNLRSATEKKDDKTLPKTYRIWNYDPGNIYEPGTDPMYICIPVYMGVRKPPGSQADAQIENKIDNSLESEIGSYLIFYENTFAGEFTFGEQATATFEQGALRYYFALGQPSTLLDRYTRLTGRPTLPPYWALGYHQSRWGYRSEAAVREEIENFQTHQLPISAIHLDIDCQVDHRAFTIDPQRFPNFSKMAAELAANGTKIVAINNPGIKYSRHSNLLVEGELLNAFCTYPNGELVKAPVWAGQMVFPDFTNPQVRHWWSRQFAYLLDIGISGFWQDMNEPAAFIAWGDPTLPQATQHHLEGRGGDHREAHNVYGLLEVRSAYEGLQQHQPQHRPFLVSRSGSAGLQRYSWTWTGDIVSTWEALRQTIPTIIGLGISGVPFCGPDIGGFLGNPSAELYLRWFQMSVFFMFCRTHCATSVSPRAPWTFSEPYLSIIRRFLQLRYRLRPYLYTLAWEASKRGTPPVRPLFWSHPNDFELCGAEDAFYLGNALLVYPILQPNLQTYSVRLPPGHWYNFWDDTYFAGDQTVQLKVSLEQIPLFVKAGTVLPMVTENCLTLHVYAPPLSDLTGKKREESDTNGNKSKVHKSFLYSDAGDGYGEFRLDYFYLTSSLGQRSEDQAFKEGVDLPVKKTLKTILEMTWEHEGDYELPYESVNYQLHGSDEDAIVINAEPVHL